MPAQADILVDAREFIPGRMTGIGRMLVGFVDALAESPWVGKIVLASNIETVPVHLKGSSTISSIMIPLSFLGAEWVLSQLTQKRYDIFISPYPKLPLFGIHCPCVHTIHDVLDLRDPIYRKRCRTFIDKERLKSALKHADLTWYDSQWSMKETEALIGYTGKNPRVRHLGVDQRFTDTEQSADRAVLEKYGLSKGYILTIGNGLPHKNIGLLLTIADEVPRTLLFVGVPVKNMQHLKNCDRTKRAIWIETVDDEDMPSLLRQAFCLSQPSLAEGYGYPPLEAMACGTPTVVSDIPVLVETTGGNALIADPLHGQSWIAAYRCLENRDAYRTQVEKGLRWVAPLRGRAGWARHVEDIAELVERGC